MCESRGTPGPTEAWWKRSAPPLGAIRSQKPNPRQHAPHHSDRPPTSRLRTGGNRLTQSIGPRGRIHSEANLGRTVVLDDDRDSMEPSPRLAGLALRIELHRNLPHACDSTHTLDWRCFDDGSEEQALVVVLLDPGEVRVHEGERGDIAGVEVREDGFERVREKVERCRNPIGRSW